MITLRALLDEAAGGGGTLAAGGSGDDRDAIGQFRHGGTTTYLRDGRTDQSSGRQTRQVVTFAPSGW